MPQNKIDEKSDNGLVPSGNKPLPNADQNLCLHKAPLGHNELTQQQNLLDTYDIHWNFIQMCLLWFHWQ